LRIAIIGSTGQLAYDLLKVLNETSIERDVIGLTHAEIEVSHRGSVRDTLTPLHPDLVINTAAFHRVDVCEDEPERAFAVNAIGAHNIALIGLELGFALVHLSTDYVFSGDKGSPYIESDAVTPINLYGVSKAAGEMAIRYLLPNHFIVRSSGLYGVAGSSGKGGNFVETMIHLAREGRDIRVVNDQTLTPTYTYPLARQIVALSQTEAYGTYHATCQGDCTWYDFAVEIFRQTELSPNLSPQTTAQSGAQATRPTYSVLDNKALKQLKIDQMPTWQMALTDYLRARSEGL
jgi:dTDP-4-dehydrorhamnose reductase